MKLPAKSASLALACLAVLNVKPRAAEYAGPETSPASSTASPIPPSATDSLRTVPRNAFEDHPAVGIPMSSIFRDTRAPYYDNLRDVSVTPSFRLNESVSATTDIDLPDFRGSFPLLHRGFEPKDADLKI